MPTLVVETPEGVSLRYELAGAGSRTAAGLVDFFLFFVVWLFLFLVALLASVADVTGISGVMLGVLAGGALILPMLYQIGFAVFWSGQTPGKRLLGLRVTDAHGYPATVLQHTLRGLFWPFEAMALAFPVPIALILLVATERRQRLGDMVAGTVVLRDRPPPVRAEPFPREVWSKLPKRRLELVPALAARLDADDFRYLRSLLGRSDLELPARNRLYRATARHYLDKLGLELEGDRDKTEARAILRELYLFLREQRSAEPATPERPKEATPPSEEAAAAVPENAPAPGSPAP